MFERKILPFLLKAAIALLTLLFVLGLPRLGYLATQFVVEHALAPILSFSTIGLVVIGCIFIATKLGRFLGFKPETDIPEDPAISATAVSQTTRRRVHRSKLLAALCLFGAGLFLIALATVTGAPWVVGTLAMFPFALGLASLLDKPEVALSPFSALVGAVTLLFVSGVIWYGIDQNSSHWRLADKAKPQTTLTGTMVPDAKD